MKNKKIYFLVGILFIIGFTFNTLPARAIIRDQTISTIAEKDTYVNSDDPLSNFGGQNYVFSGFYWGGDIVEAYFFFNFSDKPSTYTKAEISLDFWGVSQTMNVSIVLIEEEWDEYLMIWINKPTKGTEIISMIITQSDIYTINMTNYITGRNNLSICVYIKVENYVSDYFYITSREGFYSWAPEDAPQLIWTYPETTEITITSPKSSDILKDFSSYTIRWTSQGLIENVIIQLYKGSIFIEDITYMYTANDGEYDFYTLSLERGTNYRIKITDYNDWMVYDYSDYFSINIGSGTITVTRPSSSSSLKLGDSYVVTWISTGTIFYVDIEFYKGDILKYYLYDVLNIGSKLLLIYEDIEPGTDWRVKISNSDNSNQYDWSDYFTIYEKPVDNIFIPIIIVSVIIIGLIVIGVVIGLIIYLKHKKKRQETILN